MWVRPIRQDLNRKCKQGSGMMETFQDYAYYYNAFYRDKDYKNEAETVIKLLPQEEKINTILNLGCGTGRHDIELAKMGYSMTGIDVSRQMVQVAQESSEREGCKIEFAVADIREYHAEEKYDAVISLFHVISYQNSNEDLLRVFQTAGKVLRKGGTFVFDLWYGPGVLSDKPAVRVKTAEDSEYLLYRIARPDMRIEDNVVDVHYEVLVVNKETSNVQRITEVHKMRYFFIPEIRYYLEEAGFELLQCLDCRTLEKTDFNSWTAYCVARKKG